MVEIVSSAGFVKYGCQKLELQFQGTSSSIGSGSNLQFRDTDNLPRPQRVTLELKPY